jgi:flagellar hook-associated protein 2
VDHINGFVEAYNEVIDRIDELTSFDSETLARGVLFADSTVSQVENRLFRSVTGAFENTSTAVSRLSSIGISGSAGGHLSFDQDRFREVYAESPEAVEQLFTTEETGFGDFFEEVLDDLTDTIDGLIPSKDSALEKQEEMLQDRMEHMQELLDLKQARMEREFAALESALAILQGQQTALTSLQTLAFGL